MKTVAQNRRARFDYEILDTLEAGIILSGAEVKSCRAGQVHLGGSYVTMLHGRPILRNANVAPYRYAAHETEFQPTRDRELLLKKTEVAKLMSAITQKGITLIPLEVRAGKFVKVTIGLCRGRKKIDKRSVIKKREVERKLREGREY
jgi:SsrA-binding protein